MKINLSKVLSYRNNECTRGLKTERGDFMPPQNK